MNTKVLTIVVLSLICVTVFSDESLCLNKSDCVITEQKFRKISQVVTPQDTSDGAGVKLSRAIGSSHFSGLDPFLLLDEFKSDDPKDYSGGFPDHPHRGFETVTYMIAGSIEHKDHKGNHGILVQGGIQWMTAGRGIIHSEMPIVEASLLWGFQLWVNLPAASKMVEPRYQDILPVDVPEVTTEEGAIIKVLAGEINGVVGPVKDIVTKPLYLDVTLPVSSSVILTIPEDHNAFAYIFQGKATFLSHSEEEQQTISCPKLIVYEQGKSEVKVVNDDSEGARFLFVAAQPINEPIERSGPFVMNTKEEINQAYDDYRNGKF